MWSQERDRLLIRIKDLEAKVAELEAKQPPAKPAPARKAVKK